MKDAVLRLKALILKYGDAREEMGTYKGNSHRPRTKKYLNAKYINEYFDEEIDRCLTLLENPMANIR